MFKRLQQKFVSDSIETVQEAVSGHQEAIIVAGFALAVGVIIGAKIGKGPQIVVIR